MSGLIVRPGRLADISAMAAVHVRSWQETYRGLMPDAVLDDPDAIRVREHFWTVAMTDPRYATNRIAVADHEETVVGIAMAGLPEDPEATWDIDLYLIYLLARHHGSGAGTQLLNAVTEPPESVGLWVVTPNPRAQQFYGKHSFRPDGRRRSDAGVTEIHLVRPPSSRGELTRS
jgi:GNAT superfamily N-acetyltransferase